MIVLKKLFYIFAIVMLLPLKAMAYTLPVDSVADDDEAIRTGKVTIEGQDAPMAPVNYKQYPFLRLKANHINLNGADWSKVRERMAGIDDYVMSIVHIGDSHLQGEGATTVTRSLLQKFYGSSGRGLVTPFKIAGTNQPADYTITINTPVTKSTLMRMPYESPMGFIGVSITPHRSEFDLSIAVKPVDGDADLFDCVRLYCKGDVPSLVSATTGGEKIGYDDKTIADTLVIQLHDYVSNVNLKLKSAGKCQIFGAKLENSMVGVEYHVIGNNGARYDTYNRVGGMGKSIKALSPNLVIISLGTNEAFGKITDSAFYSNIDKMVRDIHLENPDAQLLLTTPAECMRKGTKNEDIGRLRNVILQYGRDNHIATYDWYEVAGGDGASEPWSQHELLSKDRIHNTMKGYRLQGALMYDALIKAFND